ncbi:MAG: dihydroorotase family protein [Armatimonadetes bacterium]|nr:dihydroorotase family protein [Armatimonadota bacterium]
MRFDLLIANGTVVTPRGRMPADIAIVRERIAAVATPGQIPADQAARRIDAGGLVILPGLIDAHTHLVDPGWPDWEDFPHGTRAAAAGGVTTVFEMPNSKPTVDSGENLLGRLRAVEHRAVVDFGLFGALGTTNGGAAPGLYEAGAIAFKTFRVNPLPGSEKARIEGGLRAPDPAVVLERFRESSAFPIPHAVHCEHNGLVDHFTARARAQGLVRAEHWNVGRPELCEIVSTAETLALARETKARLHIVHMTAPEAIVMANRAREAGQHVTIEICVQYLFYTEEDMARFDHYGKIAPPFRSKESRERLWELLGAGAVDIITTDHSPQAAADKAKSWADIFAAPAGHPGLETLLPALLTLVSAGRLSLEQVVALTGENPARIFGLYPRKGAILPGADADLVLVDMNRTQVLRRADFFTKGRDVDVWWDGMVVQGLPVTTLVRGAVVYDHGEIVRQPGHGRFVRPG